MGSRVELQVFCPRWLPTCLRVDCFEFAKCCEWMRVAVNEAVHKDLNILSPIFVWLVNSSSERSCLILFFFQNRIICPQELSSKNRDSPLVVHESRLPLYVRAFSPDGLPHKKNVFLLGIDAISNRAFTCANHMCGLLIQKSSIFT